MKVRTLTFQKRFTSSMSEKPFWITLGHLDEMECSEMKSMTLEDICRFNRDTFKRNSKDAYHHVIYLIDTGYKSDSQATDEKLWEEDCSFMSVIRIHFPDTINLRKQYEDLMKHFESLSANELYKDISWRCYYTVELSDLVLVSKFKQFQKLSLWSLLSTKTQLVGKAYTYFCIPNTLLALEESTFSEELREDVVDFLAIRFATCGCNEAEKTIAVRNCLGEEYTDKPFRVAGNEDIIICGRKVPIYNLLKLYSNWYHDAAIFNSFQDIITRIGVDQEEKTEAGAIADSKKTQLQEYTHFVADKIRRNILQNTATNISVEDREWTRPLVELSNAMVHMSCSAVLDETVFQILPGFNAFWDNVISNSKELSEEPLYLRFGELCVHTMEHLMRAEGQLSNRQEMRPLVYDIPVFVLEYATTFLLILSNELVKPDGDNSEPIRFLLVPSAEKDVSTVELFRATKENPGLLVITVPFSLLYKPKQLLASLCHEVAHYVGEKLRMRSVRYEKFLHCVAYEFQKRFFRDVSGNKEVFSDYIAKEFLSKCLAQGAKEHPNLYCDDFIKTPLYDIRELIIRLVDPLLDEAPYARFIKDYVCSEYSGASFKYLPQSERSAACIHFISRISDLSISFREIYADICMLYFLKLPILDYLDVAVRQWDGINTSTLLRVYIALATNNYSLYNIIEAMDTWAKKKGADSEKRTWAANQLEVISNLVNDPDENTSERMLVEYIRECWSELQKQYPNYPDEINNDSYTAKKVFDKIIDLSSTSYCEILEVIEQGRNIMLYQLEESLCRK